MFQKNNVKLYFPVEINGVNYPEAFIQQSTPAQLTEWGITYVPDPTRPDPALYTWAENPDGSLTITPKSPAELSAALEITRTHAHQIIKDFHATCLRTLSGDASIEERDTWPPQVAAANAVASGVPLDAGMQAFFTGVGATTPALQQALASKILTNSAKYQFVMGLAGRLKKSADAAIAAATTPAEIEAALTQSRAAAEAAMAALPV
jgi:hypothetical protein